MNFVAEGKAKVTATVTYAGVTKVMEKEIEFRDLANTPAATIGSVYETADDVEVTVKGVVVSSIANQKGFYLADETGFIAVTMTETELAKFELGQLVIVKGFKDHKVKEENASTMKGQINIRDAELVVNLYGEHEYSKTTLVTSKTFADLVEMAQEVNVDHTEFVYHVSGKVHQASQYAYSIQDPNDPEKYLTLYASGVGQYAFLKDYVGQTVEMDFALCNWNSKTPYKGAVLAIYVNGEVIVNDCNFQ
jgi:uncharacterized protein YdeI (BOF family)